MKIWVAIADEEGEIFTLGAYKSELEAIGDVYKEIGNFSASYENEGDEFEVSPLWINDSGSEYVRIKFKCASWEKPVEHFYYIQETNFEEGKQ